MSEDEAIALLERQLSGPDGWLPRYQDGADVDEAGVALTLAALAALAQHWTKQDLVPKRAIRALLPLDNPIWPYMHEHPHEEISLEDIGLQLMMAKDKVYENALPPRYEEQDGWHDGDWEVWSENAEIDAMLDDYEIALRTMYEQMGGGMGMLIEMRAIDYIFREHSQAVETTMRRLRRAFGLVQARWAGTPYLPRCLAFPFTNVQFCVLNGIGHMRNEANRPRVYAVIDKLTALIQACLAA